MKLKLLFILYFLSSFAFAQTTFVENDTKPKSKIKPTYFQFDVSVPIIGNPNRVNDDREDNSWFLPDGLNVKFGYGFHKNKWIALGLHSGIDWKATEQLVAIPVFANLRLSPKITAESRIYIQAGYGKSFALGRGNLMGDYKKINLGLESDDDLSLFVALEQHSLKYNDFHKVYSFSLGIALTTF